jgi:hypothetical protein
MKWQILKWFNLNLDIIVISSNTNWKRMLRHNVMNRNYVRLDHVWSAHSVLPAIHDNSDILIATSTLQAKFERLILTCVHSHLCQQVFVSDCTLFRNRYKILTEEPEGSHKCRWEYNIKMDFKEILCKIVYWILLAQNNDQWRSLVIIVINLRFP